MKQIARYSENRVADVIKRDRRGRTIFSPKYYSVHSAIGSRMNGIAFRSFRNRNSSQKNTSTIYYGIGINGIVPKERAPRDPSYCVYFTALHFSRQLAGYTRALGGAWFLPSSLCYDWRRARQSRSSNVTWFPGCRANEEIQLLRHTRVTLT